MESGKEWPEFARSECAPRDSFFDTLPGFSEGVTRQEGLSVHGEYTAVTSDRRALGSPACQRNRC